MHFRQVDAVLVQLGAGLLPPDGEVFAERAAQVGTVGSWLRHDLAERLAWALPVGTLHLDEHGECESSREAQDKVLCLSTKDRSHKWVGQAPSNTKSDSALASKLLQLLCVKLLHFHDFPL